MSNGDQDYLSRFELTKSHVDALVTVATAVLVLSITFIKDATVSTPGHKDLLKWSWVLFTSSIASGIAHSYVLILLVNASECRSKLTCKHRNILFALNILLHLSFFAAAGLFLLFALITV